MIESITSSIAIQIPLPEQMGRESRFRVLEAVSRTGSSQRQLRSFYLKLSYAMQLTNLELLKPPKRQANEERRRGIPGPQQSFLSSNQFHQCQKQSQMPTAESDDDPRLEREGKTSMNSLFCAFIKICQRTYDFRVFVAQPVADALLSPINGHLARIN